MPWSLKPGQDPPSDFLEALHGSDGNTPSDSESEIFEETDDDLSDEELDEDEDELPFLDAAAEPLPAPNDHNNEHEVPPSVVRDLSPVRSRSPHRNPYCTMKDSLRIVAAIAPLVVLVAATPTGPGADTGHAAGLMPDCPGVMKNATITPRMMQRYQIMMHKMVRGQVSTRAMPIMGAHKLIANDKHVDLRRKKTVVYAVGFLDSSAWPHSRAIANTYVKKGYNVFVTETLDFFTLIYPKSARLARVIGKKLGEFLIRLKNLGMEADNLELIGMSLGSHVVSFAAKHFYKVSGEKPFRITGLDPAGPCFRNLPPEEKLNRDDAKFVDVVHTNIDGFGIAEPLGHIDFYVNGGEFQPSDIAYVPCLIVCSHLRAMFYWWIALDHPKKFIAMSCDSVEDARNANCYKDPHEINHLGLETNFTKPGIYYLATDRLFPYYRGKDGLKSENEIFSSEIKKINSDDVLVV